MGVEANGIEAGVAEHIGDGDQVGAAADEGGGEGVAADVGGDVFFVEVGVGGDGSDDVAGAADRQPPPAAGEQPRRAGARAAPARAVVGPGFPGGGQLGGDTAVAAGGGRA